MDREKSRCTAASAWIRAATGLCALIVLPALATAQEMDDRLNLPDFTREHNTVDEQEQSQERADQPRQRNETSRTNGNDRNTAPARQRELFGNTPDDIGAQLRESEK